MRIKFSQPILIFILLVLISIAFYIVQLLYTNTLNGRSSRIYEQSLVASINQYEYLPALLSQDQSLRAVILNPTIDHLPASKKLAFISQRSGADAVYIMDIEGTVKASSNYDMGSKSFLNRNYAFRPYFKDALSKEERQFYYAKGATTGIPGFFISAPIIHDAKAIGVVVIKLDMRHWEQKWSESGENIIVVDENNIAILSSLDEWRYRSVGKLPESTLEKIEQQQQFLNTEHSSIYSKSIDLKFSNDTNKAFWLIDKKLYLINRFEIPETGWTLYYLVKHDAILTSSAIFFVVATLLSTMAYLLIHGRRRIIESKNTYKLLEIKRREELQTVLDNIHIGVLVFSESGKLLSANEHAQHLLFEADELTQSNNITINQLIKLENNDVNQLILEDISAPAYHESVTTPKSKPAIPVMFAVSKVHALDQDAYLMTLVNIKRRKVVEDKLVKINEDLENIVEERTKALDDAQTKLIQKNKATALGNMAATIVHELSQPLTAMSSSIAAINAKISKNDWDGVIQSATRLSPLSNKMYEVIKLLKFFSYQDRESFKQLELNSSVKDVIAGLNDALKEKNIETNIHYSSQPLFIYANPLKIDLILSNILQNAIDELEKVESRLITITLEEANGIARVYIEDNAGGLEKGIMEKMFSPYFTTKEVGKGLGLGLAITYEIIQEYNGTIEAENIGLGARFTISLPKFEALSDDHREDSVNALNEDPEKVPAKGPNKKKQEKLRLVSGK
jgi:C4-dicarboxylate-specific signal transduction histidine kinase